MELKSSLIHIADTLQIPLTYTDGQITGSRKFTIELAPELSMTMEPRAVKLFVGDTNGVLFHVMGHLWCMVVHYRPKNALSAFLIDGKGIDPASTFSTYSDLPFVVRGLRKNIVDSFTFHNKDKTWKQLKLPA